MVKDSFAGKKGLCPECKVAIVVPAAPPDPEPKPFVEPTDRQLAYAQSLGVAIAPGVSRKELSNLIDGAKENAPATENQKAYLRDLGVSFPQDIKSNQISMLIDAATNIREQVVAGIIPRYEKELKEAGMLVEYLTDEQLLHELRDRGKDFFAFMLDNDEFRYKNLPISGQLRWTESLNLEDVKYMLLKLAGEWAVNLDLKVYTEEFDGTLPSIQFTADEIAYQGTVHRVNLTPKD